MMHYASSWTLWSLVLWCLLAVEVTVAEDVDCPEYECPAKDGSFADPCTCRRFYQCVENFPYQNFCPTGLYWDDIKKFCTFKNEAVCGPVSTTPAPSTTPSPDQAKKCNAAECQLPFCFCSSDGTLIPGGLDPKETPQMIMIMLDGAINQNNFATYKRIFNSRKSPNGCDLKGTFFITHHYSDYQNIESLRHLGHEIAVGSISDDAGLYLKNYTAWVDEVVGMREILKNQADIREDEILGIRAPGLKPGQNDQYDVLIDYGFIWDSSIGVPPLSTPVWPYTLDYKIPHECKSETCPARQFPGLWEIPLNSHHVEGFVGGHCPYIDQCVLTNMDSDDIFGWLKEDFLHHYDTNRAPYTLAMHTNWFNSREQVQGLHQFLNWTETLEDVYYVTATQALLWMTEPTSLKEIKTFQPWLCDQELPKAACTSPAKCALPHTENGINVIKYMTTCKSCPARYPWLGNVRGKDTETRDTYPKPEKK